MLLSDAFLAASVDLQAFMQAATVARAPTPCEEQHAGPSAAVSTAAVKQAAADECHSNKSQPSGMGEQQDLLPGAEVKVSKSTFCLLVGSDLSMMYHARWPKASKRAGYVAGQKSRKILPASSFCVQPVAVDLHVS